MTYEPFTKEYIQERIQKTQAEADYLCAIMNHSGPDLNLNRQLNTLDDELVLLRQLEMANQKVADVAHTVLTDFFKNVKKKLDARLLPDDPALGTALMLEELAERLEEATRWRDAKTEPPELAGVTP